MRTKSVSPVKPEVMRPNLNAGNLQPWLPTHSVKYGYLSYATPTVMSGDT